MADEWDAFVAMLDRKLAELDRRRGAILKLKDGIASYEQATGVSLRDALAAMAEEDGHAVETTNGNGHAPEPANGDKPRGRDAVRMIVSERPGLWPLADIVSEFERRGWLVSRKAVEVAVHRLTGDGEVRRVEQGVYEFPATPTTEGVPPC